MATVQTKVYAKDKETFARLKSLKQTELLKVPVSAVPFCARAQNAFEKIGVTTLGDLVNRTKFQLLKVQNLGRNTMAQVEAYLDVLGLRLGMGAPVWPPAAEPELEFEAEVEAEAQESTPDLRAMLAEAQKATAEALKLNERMVSIIEKLAAGGAR